MVIMPSHKDFAIQFAYQAWEIIKSNFLKNNNSTRKSDNTVVTQIDQEINTLFIQAVQSQFPTHSIRGEEESYVQTDSEYTWICDPIDGTALFTMGIPTSTCGIALLHHDTLILWVIYNPYMDRMYVAEQWKWATCNEQSIHVSDASDMSKYYIAAASWSWSKHNMNYLRPYIKEHKWKITSAGSIQYSGWLVASGKMLGCMFGGNTIHDIAPVHIIVQEAGWIVTDLQGNPIDYSQELQGMIACTPWVHQQLIQTIQEVFKTS